MKILITGGAGFIGSNLCRHLISVGGYDITVLDNMSVGQEKPDLPDGIEFVYGDYTDAEIVSRCLRRIDAVIHLAALSGVVDSIEDPRPSFRVNVAGSFQLLDLARHARVGRFINASTGGALMGGDIEPPISESMVPSPLSPYGASKLAVEGYCSAFAGAYGLKCMTLRFSNIYGPRSGHKKTVIASFIKSVIQNESIVIYGDGTQQRDYLYVDDLVRGIEAALKTDLTGSYQLGSGRPTSLNTLLEVLEKVCNQDLKPSYAAARRGEVHSTWCSIEKAQSEFGYTAPTDLEKGVRATWIWYRENQDIWSRQRVISSSD